MSTTEDKKEGKKENKKEDTKEDKKVDKKEDKKEAKKEVKKGVEKEAKKEVKKEVKVKKESGSTQVAPDAAVVVVSDTKKEVKDETKKEEGSGAKREVKTKEVKDETKKEEESGVKRDLKKEAGEDKLKRVKVKMEEHDRQQERAWQVNMWNKFENKGLPEEFSRNGREVQVSFRLSSLSVLTRVLEMLTHLCKDVSFQCSKSGLVLATMDTAQAVLVDLSLTTGTLKEYSSTDENCNLVFNLHHLQGALKLVQGDYDVYFRKLEGDEHFQARYIDGTEESVESGWFNIHLLTDNMPTVTLPTGDDYAGQVKLGSTKLHRIVNQLSQVGSETLGIHGNKDSLNFLSSTLDMGAEVILKDTRAGDELTQMKRDAENEVHVNICEGNESVCHQSFNMKYFQIFAKCNTLSPIVDLKWSCTLPFCISFTLGETKDCGHVVFHIAPKIDDGEF